MKIPPVGAELLHADRQTDKHDEANSQISQFLANKSKNILLYKSQQDAHVTGFILSDNFSTCFGRHHHPSSGA